MVIYIAGKMTGLPDYGRDKFRTAQEELEAGGYTVINPAVLPTTLRKESYMPICMAMIDAADAIYALKGFDKSVGALLEIHYARYQGKDVIYQK